MATAAETVDVTLLRRPLQAQMLPIAICGNCHDVRSLPRRWR